MNYKIMSNLEFLSLSLLSRSDEEIVLKLKNVCFYNPVNQDFPIYKISFLVSDDSTFKELEIFSQRADSKVSRWDKSWEDSGIPVAIYQMLKL